MVATEEEDSTDSLKFCLTGTRTDLVGWGHEYLRCLAGQIGHEYENCVEKDLPTEQIHQLVDQIIPEFINHNEEPEAVDLLLEVERLQDLTKFTSATNFDRVCIYLLSCAPYAADTDEMSQTYRTVIEIYRKHKKFPEALRVAQKLNDVSMIAEIMAECTD
jgi:26S proteasome regulatory subunit N1